MPRRNRRDSFEPLDLTPADIGADISAHVQLRKARRVTPQQETARRERNAKRQAEAKINRGIDWSVCLVPGCGFDLPVSGHAEVGSKQRDHRNKLPLCHYHAAVANAQVFHMQEDPLMVQAAALLTAYQQNETRRLHADEQEAFLKRQDGDIYFVRLNGMVKAGWTRDLKARLKAYGASVEVLAHYPATRDDETNLHRQLRPALVKGREWYEDGPIVQSFIDDAIRQHGQPYVTAYWTEPKGPAIRKRR